MNSSFLNGEQNNSYLVHSTSCICNGYSETYPSMMPNVDIYAIEWLEDVTPEIELVSSITPKEVPQECHFLLEINFAGGHMILELKVYWILAVKAALATQNKELAQDRPKRICSLVNTKIPSKKKLGITDVKQQIRADKGHCISTEKEHMHYNPEDHHTLENYLKRKHPHPSSPTASLKSNNHHCEPN
jgi:hypothetical protein